MTAEQFYEQCLINQDAIITGLQGLANLVNGVLVVVIGMVVYNLFWGNRK